MFDEKTILARLQNGEDAQTIADEMAAMINAVNKTYADQKAAEEAAKKTEIQKYEDLQEILDMFVDWFGTYYEIDVEDLKSELKADEVIELVDSLKGYIDAVKGLESMFSVKNATKPTPKIIKSNTKPKSADERISDFLNKMGW